MLQGFLESLDGTAIGLTVKTSVWMFPVLEALHFIGLALLIGGIAALDLRVLGVAKRLPIAPLHKLLPLDDSLCSPALDHPAPIGAASLPAAPRHFAPAGC